MGEKKGTLLLVDDSRETLNVLAELLNVDYNIKAATNGDDALKIVNESDGIDLILLDIMMPDKDGYEVCIDLKNNDETKDIPVIFLTAKTESADVVRGFDAGAVDYVPKPFNIVELLARVNTHVELKKVTDLLKEKNKHLSLINLEIHNASKSSDTKVEYLTNRLTKILHGSEELQEKVGFMDSLIPSLAVNDLAILKMILNVLEGSSTSIANLVKIGSEEDDAMRVLPLSVEPLKTAIVDIESVINVLIKLGLVTMSSIENVNINRTSFYDIIENLFKTGKISHKKFQELSEMASFSRRGETDDGTHSIIF